VVEISDANQFNNLVKLADRHFTAVRRNDVFVFAEAKMG
jgi:hypothetical protein